MDNNIFQIQKFYAIILTCITKMCPPHTLCFSISLIKWIWSNISPFVAFDISYMWLSFFLNAKLWFNLSNYCTDISRLNIVNNIVFSVFWKSESKVFGSQPNISFHHNLCYHLLVLHAAIDKFILKRQNIRRRKILEAFYFLSSQRQHMKRLEI